MNFHQKRLLNIYHLGKNQVRSLLVGAGNLFTAAEARFCENNKDTKETQNIEIFIILEEKFNLLFIN